MKGILRDLFHALIFPPPYQLHSSCACIPPTRPLLRLLKGNYWHQIRGPWSLWNPASSRIPLQPYHWTSWCRSWSRKQRGHVCVPSPSSTWRSRDEHCAPPLSDSCGCALSRKSGKPSPHLERTQIPGGDVLGSVLSGPGCRRGPQVLPLFPLGPRLSEA